MGISISSAALDAIRMAAAAAPQVEVCGLLFGTRDRIDAVEPCANVSPSPERAFEIDPAALLRAHRRARGDGPMLAGHYHSHPSGRAVPSACDAASAMGDGAVWLIVAQEGIRAWRTDAPGTFVEEPIEPAVASSATGRG